MIANPPQFARAGHVYRVMKKAGQTRHLQPCKLQLTARIVIDTQSLVSYHTRLPHEKMYFSKRTGLRLLLYNLWWEKMLV